MYNADGYKTINFLAFGDTSLPASKINAGTVLGVLNPRLMQARQGNDSSGPMQSESARNQNQETSFSIESEDAMIKIGFSQDFNICPATSPHANTQQPIACIRFINTSVEKICDKHKQELQMRQL